MKDIMAVLQRINDRLDAIEQSLDGPDVIVIEAETNELRDDTIIPVPEVNDSEEEVEEQPNVPATPVAETREQELERLLREAQENLERLMRRQRARESARERARTNPYDPYGTPEFPWDQWHRYYSRMSHQMRRRFQEHTQQRQAPEVRYQSTRHIRVRQEGNYFVNPETGERYTRSEMSRLFGPNFLRNAPEFREHSEEEE